LNEAQRRDAAVIEPTPEAVDDWVSTINEVSAGFMAYQQHCVPSYFNADGRRDKVGVLAGTAFTPGVIVFTDLISRWREAGFAGLTFSRSTVGN
jgi:cyclohexanone monooxygenase